MVTDTRIEYRPNPLRQGSRNRRGDQVDQEFVGQVLHLLGDVRALWLPSKSGATLTDRSRYVRVLTWSEDVSAFDTKPVELGSGYAVHFNGTDEEGDAPDADELSFGDGAVDQPFSVIALVRPDTNSNTEAILAKRRADDRFDSKRVVLPPQRWAPRVQPARRQRVGQHRPPRCHHGHCRDMDAPGWNVRR